jgi:hypothetical protein
VDAVIAVVQWVFVVSLLPMVFHPTEKPSFSAAVLTATCFIVMAFTMATLPHLGMTAWSMAAAGIVWTVLAWQRYRINKRTDEPLFRRPKWMTRVCLPDLLATRTGELAILIGALASPVQAATAELEQATKSVATRIAIEAGRTIAQLAR